MDVYSAINAQQNLNNTIARAQPYVDLGNSAINPLMAAMGDDRLQSRFAAPTADEAAATPGYQFTLDNGLRAVQNSAAARGLGSSGAALQGAASYASGLANSTYNDVYTRALNTFNTNYSSAANNVNRLQGLVSNGQNAALGTAAASTGTSFVVGNSLSSAGNAYAGGASGAASANASGANSLANGLGSYALLSNNSGSGVSGSALRTANNSSDPIGALNSSQGWTP